MKKIGMIDAYISEWHANHTPEWIAATNAELGTDYQISYVFAEQKISPVDGLSTGEWCRREGAQECKSIEELCEKSDAFMIMAPSDPDRHLAYAQAAFPYGKPTFIDKTYAEDAKTGEEIFALSKQYGTPFFTSSALRFASELQTVGKVKNLIVTGGYSNLSEYAVHPLEIAVRLLGAQKVTKTGIVHQGGQHFFSFETEKGAKATVILAPGIPFTVTAEEEDGKGKYLPLTSPYFRLMDREIIRFFESREAPFPYEETRLLMRLRDELLKG